MNREAEPATRSGRATHDSGVVVGVGIDPLAIAESFGGDEALRRAAHEELLDELAVHGTLGRKHAAPRYRCCPGRAWSCPYRSTSYGCLQAARILRNAMPTSMWRFNTLPRFFARRSPSEVAVRSNMQKDTAGHEATKLLGSLAQQERR